MTDSIDAEVTGDSSKPENGEHLIIVIWFDNLSNIENCALILVLGAQIMQ